MKTRLAKWCAVGSLVVWLWIAFVLWVCYHIDPWRTSAIQFAVGFMGLLLPGIIVVAFGFGFCAENDQ